MTIITTLTLAYNDEKLFDRRRKGDGRLNNMQIDYNDRYKYVENK